MNVSSRFDVAGFGAIVTGGASGLGLAYGEVLAAHGARVTLIDIDADAVAEQASRLQGEGLDVRGAVADVTDHAALDRAIDEAAAAYGRLDVAFANAGIDPGVGFVGAWAGGERPRVEEGALERYTDERWNRVIDINLNGIFATARAAARHMRPRGFGRIIVTTSLAATKVEPAIGAAYMAAKAGATAPHACLALELAADGITVNAIAPGFFVTNIGGGHAHNPDLQAAIAKDIPDASRRPAGRHQGARALPRVAGLRVHHRPGDRDRRRLGAGSRGLRFRRAQRPRDPGGPSWRSLRSTPRAGRCPRPSGPSSRPRASGAPAARSGCRTCGCSRSRTGASTGTRTRASSSSTPRAAGPLARVFGKLYALRFPIRHLQLADMYGPTADRPPTATSAARSSAARRCRRRAPAAAARARGRCTPTGWPWRSTRSRTPTSAAGRAATRGQAVLRPLTASPWDGDAAGDRRLPVDRLGWGGSWTGGTKDYMHFSSTGH